MSNQFLTNYTEVTFLDKIKDNLRRCKSFAFSVSFIKKAGLILLKKDGATVSSDVLVKICTALNCTMDDIVEIVPNTK